MTGGRANDQPPVLNPEKGCFEGQAKERIGAHDQGIGVLLEERRECRVEIAFDGRPQDCDLWTAGARGLLNVRHLAVGFGAHCEERTSVFGLAFSGDTYPQLPKTTQPTPSLAAS